MWRTRSVLPSRSVGDGLRLWFRVSVGSAAFAAVALLALVVVGIPKEWLVVRYSAVLAPLGAIVAASIASAGAARLAMAQTANADRTRLEDAEKDLWSRFEGAAKQLADKSHFAIRVAGVYAFVGLADDWLRHQRKKNADSTANVLRAECETITDTLCAYLRQNTHIQVAPGTAKAERIVNEAIIGQFRVHLALKKKDSQEAGGQWAGIGLKLDLHGVDLERSYFNGMDLKDAVLVKADLFDVDLRGSNLDGATLRGADLSGADLTEASVEGTKFDEITYDSKTKWPTGFTPPASATMRAEPRIAA
ncbi:hypothetical protein B2J88_49110 [Rhodococcus sp. SRB_17]|nr:hypothetical protein [Rhodococcus sp. SRB_17]